MHVIGTRWFRNIGAAAYGQAVQLAAQVITVPVLLAHWGLEVYGSWVMLLTIPAYLAMADFGISFAAATRMITLTAQGRDRAASRLFCAVQRLQLALIFSIGSIVALVLFVVPHSALELAGRMPPDDQRTVLLCLALYGLMALPKASIMAGFSAADRHAFGGMFFVSMGVLEATAILLLVLLGGGLKSVAIAYLAISIGCAVVGQVILRRYAPWLRHSNRARFGRRELRQLMRPAGAFMLLPAGNATLFQGSAALFGFVRGADMVPALTVPRTLARFSFQMAMVISTASIQRFTVANARNDTDHATMLLAVNLAVIGIILTPSAAILMGFGPEIVKTWTGGHVSASQWLFIPLTLSVVLCGIWSVYANALISINRHTAYAAPYFALSAGGVLLGGGLSTIFGVQGVVWSLAAVDLAMTILIIRIAAASGLPTRADVWAAWRRFLTTLRTTR